MKNLLFLGVIALLLFSLSAALSLWLNQSRQQDTTEKDKAIPKPAAPGGDLKTAPDPKVPAKLTPIISGPDTAALDQQAKLERKALQISMVLQDVQAQREATDALLKQVTAELKTATKNPEPDPKLTADLKKQQEESRANEKKNLEKLAAVYDAMTPEGAAPILKQMAESGTGKMEQAAQILALMKERNSARLLEAINDAALAAQLMDKVRQLKTLTPPPATSPGTVGTSPARTP